MSVGVKNNEIRLIVEGYVITTKGFTGLSP